MNTHQQDRIGQLVAWGANHVGQAGRAPGPDLAAPLVVAGLPLVKAVCVNSAAMLALDADGRVWSWGWSLDGVLGRPCEAGPLVWLPTALRNRGHALTPASGDGVQGGLSAPSFVSLSPGVVPGLPPMRQVTLANDRACALDESGLVWTWGGPPQFGNDGRALQAPPPCRVDGLTGIRQLSAAPDGHAFYAVDQDGRLWSWGEGFEGELGRGKRRSDPVPGPVELPAPVHSVHAGAFCCLALLQDGTAWGWGSSDSLLGFYPAKNNTMRVLAPVRIAPLNDVGQMWFTGRLAIFRTRAGASWASGTGVGMLDPQRGGEPSREPQPCPQLDEFMDFGLGDCHGFAVSATGGAVAFGSGEGGALGNGSLQEDVHSGVIPLALPGTPSAFAAFAHHSFAIVGRAS